MWKETDMECLYHYCSNEKCFAILNSHSIRLSDVQRSNDYRELNLFFPQLIFAVENAYKSSPFSFMYNGVHDEEAILRMTKISFFNWQNRFSNGDFSNFVLCFSEDLDSLSQWRGYADNGKGCCIGFSKQALQDYCKEYDSILRMEKVEYLSALEINQEIEKAAKVCIDGLKDLRSSIVENMTHDDDDPNTDLLLHYNFDGMLGAIFNETLKFKSNSFSDEKEWRVFLRNTFSKNPKWLCNEAHGRLSGPNGFRETMEYLNGRIEFRITDNDIVPFVPISFSDFSDNPVVELWTGPKNIIREKDIELFLRQKGYMSTKPHHSSITYC